MPNLHGQAPEAVQLRRYLVECALLEGESQITTIQTVVEQQIRDLYEGRGDVDALPPGPSTALAVPPPKVTLRAISHDILTIRKRNTEAALRGDLDGVRDQFLAELEEARQVAKAKGKSWDMVEASSRKAAVLGVVPQTPTQRTESRHLHAHGTIKELTDAQLTRRLRELAEGREGTALPPADGGAADPSGAEEA